MAHLHRFIETSVSGNIRCDARATEKHCPNIVRVIESPFQGLGVTGDVTVLLNKLFETEGESHREAGRCRGIGRPVP